MSSTAKPSTPHWTGTNLQVLTERECRRLLRAHPSKVGRLAFTIGERVMILPVNYRVWDGSIVFRSEEGSKLYAALTRQEMAFEVDDVDTNWQDGWSVVVQGSAREITRPDEIAAVDALGLYPWAGIRGRLLRLDPRMITGRRLT